VSSRFCGRIRVLVVESCLPSFYCKVVNRLHDKGQKLLQERRYLKALSPAFLRQQHQRGRNKMTKKKKGGKRSASHQSNGSRSGSQGPPKTQNGDAHPVENMQKSVGVISLILRKGRH